MKLELNIMLSSIFKHPLRIFLATLAMIASSCVVVWVVSGYDAMSSRFRDSAKRTLGRYDLVVVPESWKKPQLDSEILKELQKDDSISSAEPVLQCRATVTRADGFAGELPSFVSLPSTKSKINEQEKAGTEAEQGKNFSNQEDQKEFFGEFGSEFDTKQRPGNKTREEIQKDKVKRFSSRDSQSRAVDDRSSENKFRPQSSSPMMRMMMLGNPVIVGTNSEEPPISIKTGSWLANFAETEHACVVSEGVAERFKLDVDSELIVKSETGEFKLKVIGIIEQSRAPMDFSPGKLPSPNSIPRGPAPLAVYVPMKLAEKISGEEGKISLIYIILKKGTDIREFSNKWTKKLAQFTTKAELLSLKDIESAIEQNRMATSVKMQAYSATAISLMASLFIIFTTLSMGVNERIRQFAILRAVALSRGQIATMIALESLVFGLIGWIGGLLSGWILLKTLANPHPDLFRNGAELGFWSVLLTAMSAFGGSLTAGIIPAWRATQIDPLSAFTPAVKIHRFKLSWGISFLGVILVLLNILLVFVVPIPDSARYFIHAGIGYTCMGLGFILLIPLIMFFVDKIFRPVLSLVLRIDPNLLKSQITSNMWRTLGTTVSLSIGLALYVATVTWGYSMLQPFIPGDWVPDMLFSFQRGAILDFEVDNIRLIKGIKADQCIPLAVEQPELFEDITHSEEKSSVTRQNNVIIIGLDPQIAFGGTSPVLRPKFVEGTIEDAIKKLQSGRYCIVPDHFLKTTGLKLGDSFKMTVPEEPNKIVEYKIAAAVSLPGWHWMTKFSGLRRRSGRAAAMIFANFANVREDFNLEKVNFVWMNIEKSADIEEIGRAAQEIGDRNLGKQQPVNAQGMWAFGARNFGKSLRITTPNEIRERINSRADGMIWAMCQLPLITLLISGLAVLNTVVASVRARRWEMGIMRALGLSKFSLFRLVIAEAVMIGIVACIVSISFGIMAGYCGTAISQYVSFFGGLETPLYIPWSKILSAIALTLTICLFAALYPAISVGRSEILKLLADGRSAM